MGAKPQAPVATSRQWWDTSLCLSFQDTKTSENEFKCNYGCDDSKDSIDNTVSVSPDELLVVRGVLANCDDVGQLEAHLLSKQTKGRGLVKALMEWASFDQKHHFGWNLCPSVMRTGTVDDDAATVRNAVHAYILPVSVVLKSSHELSEGTRKVIETKRKKAESRDRARLTPMQLASRGKRQKKNRTTQIVLMLAKHFLMPYVVFSQERNCTDGGQRLFITLLPRMG